MQISGAQAQKIVALVIGLYVGLVLFQPSWATADLFPGERVGGTLGVAMALLSILGAALAVGRPVIAAALFGLGAAWASTSGTRRPCW